jgi:hypothetical protein
MAGPAVGLAAIAAIGSSTASIAKADEVLKFRITTHVTSVQNLDVGDADGHTLGVARFSGLALFPDGSVNIAYFSCGNDYTKGARQFWCYFNLTMKDGSTLWWKGTGQAVPQGAETFIREFPISVLKRLDD